MKKDFYSIVICERTRIGRCFLISLFAEDLKLFSAVYDRMGDDISWCAVQLVLCNEEKETWAEFHWKEKTWERSPLTEEAFSQYVKYVAEDTKDRRETAYQIEDGSYMEVHMPPGHMAEGIMKECNVNRLVITDTPEPHEKDGFIAGCSADLIMVVIEKDIATEGNIISHQEWTNKFGMWAGYGKTGIFYRTGWSCDESGISVQVFTEELQRQIIEEIRIIKKLSDEEMTKEGEALIKKLNQLDISENDVVVLVQKIIADCQYIEPEDISHEYTLEDFKREKHDRVKSGDKNRIFDSVKNARWHQLRNILMAVLKCEKKAWPQEWQQMVIRYVYHMLSLYVKKDVGIGTAIHYAEARPPVTMYAIESMLAEDLLMAVICKQGTKEEKRKKYIEVMRKYNVVNVINVDIHTDIKTDKKARDAILKMELTIRCGLDKIKTHAKSDTIGYRYVMSLQKLGEYRVWETISAIHKITEEEIKNGYARQQMKIADYRGCLYCSDNMMETENI